jgi:cytochrome c-type biogenesis protein
VEALFTSLGQAVAGAPALALVGSFMWGLLSVILSPCHLSSIPLVVGYLSGGEETSFRKGFAVSTTFAVGILTTTAAIGLATAALGRMLGDIGRVGSFVVAGVLVFTGIVLMDLVAIPWSSGPVAGHRRGHGGAFALGLVFGTGLGPCTFAFMAPVLAVALRTSGAGPGLGAALLVAYGLGHALVIAFAGASVQVVQRFLSSWLGGVGAIALKRVCGALVVVAGMYLAWNAR